jgi:hypothetical protein
MFTKVRPFQKQYYKYAHAKNYNDLFATNRRYLEDVTPDGIFEWSLHNATDLSGAFTKSRGTTVGINPSIRIFRCSTPNVTNVYYMFPGLSTLEYIEMDFDKVTNYLGWFVADGCTSLRKYPDNMYSSSYNVTQAFKGTIENGLIMEQDEDMLWVIPYHDFINSCTTMTACWMGVWRRGAQYWYKMNIILSRREIRGSYIIHWYLKSESN